MNYENMVNTPESVVYNSIGGQLASVFSVETEL